MNSFELRYARLSDIDDLRALECRAGQLFAQIPELAHFAGDECSLTVERQTELISQQKIWVIGDTSASAASSNDVSAPCGYLAVDLVDKCVHIYELSVDPQYQRRGLGRMLLDAAARYARSVGINTLSLTTDRYAPWNGPMYAKRGFSEIEATQLGPGHVRVEEKEREEGLPMERRCTMFLRVPPG